MYVTPDFLRSLAAAAAKETLPRFRRPHDVANKLEGGFDPVTEADREAERAIRRLIEADFPDHGILGEEFGPHNLPNHHCWVIDPIDGTRAFISGLPLWGTLVGLLEDGDAVAGMMSQPFTGELFHATGGVARYEGPGGPRDLRVRATTELRHATLCTTTPSLFLDDARTSYDTLETAVQLARYGTDCYAYCMLAAGQVDLVVETGLQAYDIVALIPIIEAAGGVITSRTGGPAEAGGFVVAAATLQLHAAALEMLNG
ncbi:MAG: histidinol-phosphatase [Aliihoeflea sp.]|uniref:histidinol-phosphatase n=1 Tax=Aliihoeflea sp. TaxID=2608088 RepID=UPI0040339FAA